MPDGYVLGERTAQKLKLLLGDQGAGDPPRKNRPDSRRPALVRCTSASAASGGGVGAQCYPGVILLDEADATAETDGAACWLTLWKTDGTTATPTSGQVYPTILAGHLTVGTDERQRAFCGNPPSGSSPVTAASSNVSGSITATSMTATGVQITLPSAGMYLLFATMQATAKLSFLATARGSIRIELYDSTNAANIAPNTTRVVVAPEVVNTDVIGSAQIVVPFEATGSTVIQLRAQRYDPSGSTWTSSSFDVAHVGYLKFP